MTLNPFSSVHFLVNTLWLLHDIIEHLSTEHVAVSTLGQHIMYSKYLYSTFCIAFSNVSFCVYSQSQTILNTCQHKINTSFSQCNCTLWSLKNCMSSKSAVTHLQTTCEFKPLLSHVEKKLVEKAQSISSHNPWPCQASPRSVTRSRMKSTGMGSIPLTTEVGWVVTPSSSPF